MLVVVVLTTKAQAFIYHKLPYHKRCLEIIKRLKQSLLAVIMVLTVYLFFVDMPSYVLYLLIPLSSWFNSTQIHNLWLYAVIFTC